MKNIKTRGRFVCLVVIVAYSMDHGDVFIREIVLNNIIGIDKFTNQATNMLTVLTDEFGNLITACLGVIK